jgi:hypothetical protein
MMQIGHIGMHMPSIQKAAATPSRVGGISGGEPD